MPNDANWWIDKMELHPGDIAGEFFSLKMYRYADDFERGVLDWDEYTEMENATARRLNAAYNACARIPTELLEEGIVNYLLDAVEEIVKGDGLEGLEALNRVWGQLQAKKFYGEVANDAGTDQVPD